MSDAIQDKIKRKEREIEVLEGMVRVREARLAAVMARCEEMRCGRNQWLMDELLALACGEGYEASTAETKYQQNATSEGGEQATGKDQPETGSGDPVKGHRQPAALPRGALCRASSCDRITG